MVQAFDSVLYPYVVGKYGFWVGGHIMVWASALACLLTLEFYDWSKRDWLGIETLKEAREMENTRMNRLISRLFKKSRWVQIVVLSIAQDPFVVMVFLREGSHKYGKVVGRDWQNFFASLVIANLFWTGVCWSGIKALEAIGASVSTAIMILCVLLILIALTGVMVGKWKDRKGSNTQQTS